MNTLAELASILPDPDTDPLGEVRDALRTRITVLNERAWEGRVGWELICRWLENFNGRTGVDTETERVHALYILSQFLYYGSTEIRVLLRAIYSDLYFAPMIQEVRRSLNYTRDITIIERELRNEVAATRFLGIGNPSESGVHLLYYFRQENCLPKSAFMDASSIMERTVDENGRASRSVNNDKIKRYVFIDDVCGSGDTAIRFSQNVLEEIAQQRGDVDFHYLCTFATADGLSQVRNNTLFGSNAAAIFELDSSYKCLSNESRHLKVVPKPLDVETIRQIALEYGKVLLPGHAGGFLDSQMLLGFHHNTPDNTLPIIWADHDNHAQIRWTPAFKRYPKMLG